MVIKNFYEFISLGRRRQEISSLIIRQTVSLLHCPTENPQRCNDADTAVQNASRNLGVAQ
jgi:hypothetical protein